MVLFFIFLVIASVGEVHQIKETNNATYNEQVSDSISSTLMYESEGFDF